MEIFPFGNGAAAFDKALVSLRFQSGCSGNWGRSECERCVHATADFADLEPI